MAFPPLLEVPVSPVAAMAAKDGPPRRYVTAISNGRQSRRQWREQRWERRRVSSKYKEKWGANLNLRFVFGRGVTSGPFISFIPP